MSFINRNKSNRQLENLQAKKQWIWLFILFTILLNISCKKLVEVNAPSTSLTGKNVFSSDATASAVLIGLYSRISNEFGNYRSVAIRLGLSADELSLFSTDPTLSKFYTNNLTNEQRLTFWETFYNYLEIINSAMDGLSNSGALSPAVKQQLLGEALFMRAFIHFYLVNLYGDVPIITSSDYRVNALVSREAKDKVYKQIVSDLLESQNLLSTNYVGSNSVASSVERIRPNKFTATALLAKVYLYLSDWLNAEAQATSIISNNATYDTVSLNSVFLKNNKEAIWQLQPVNNGFNTDDGRLLILPSSGPSNSFPVYLDSNLVKSFEVGDVRKTSWVGSVSVGNIVYYYPLKYKIGTFNSNVTSPGNMAEYLNVFRLSEQYLIRAEARAQLNKIAEAQADLNVIRKRARLLTTTASSQITLLDAIFQERRVELFTEWGNRWLDLKRTGKIDQVMPSVSQRKGATWNSNWALYPLPLFDLQANPNLKQNPGY